jgi:hypothetical protein
MSCTVPWPFRKWFDARFKVICDEHDRFYKERVWRVKIMSDFLIAARFAERGYILIAFGSVPYNLIVGTLYWWWKGKMEVLNG